MQVLQRKRNKCMIKRDRLIKYTPLEHMSFLLANHIVLQYWLKKKNSVYAAC